MNEPICDQVVMRLTRPCAKRQGSANMAAQRAVCSDGFVAGF